MSGYSLKIPHGGTHCGVTATAMSLKPVQMQLVASRQFAESYVRTTTGVAFDNFRTSAPLFHPI
ncbi:hypothetical protein MESS2_300048 [Mesorhizobium metallidurans STM 2683]|uniref:Uncharacterized protein n=1 Tax=Mesorhizobium metallidurans STM 2683 TaxID=1297569 RepID=M5EQF3_9HYPH|nr:hypothetical protein MESS2_300048 [Mesorhizobium metallidurans STM 2683]